MSCHESLQSSRGEMRTRPQPRARAEQRPLGAAVLQLQARAGNRATRAALAVLRDKADPKKADPAFTKQWPAKGPDDFYALIRPLVETARTGDAKAAQALTDLVAGMKASKHNRAYILDKIRVEAQKSPGGVHGSGLDELFQTASTDEWISRAAGANAKARPHSLYQGKIFTWVDAQEYARVRTESVVWFTKNLVSGHSGAIWQESGKGWHTNFQKEFHARRDEAERNSTTPRNAVIRAIALMLSMTANAAAWVDPLNKFRGETSGGHHLKAVAERTTAWITFEAYRDQLKLALEHFEANSSEDPKLEYGPSSDPNAPAYGFVDPHTSQPVYYPPASPQWSYGFAPPSPLSHPYPSVAPVDPGQWGSFIKTPQTWH